MQLLILTLLVAAASALHSSYGSYGSYGYPYYSNYGGYGGSLYGPSYGSYGGAVSYDLGGYGTGYGAEYGTGYGAGYGSSYSYQPARLYTYRNGYGGASFPAAPGHISFVMGTSALRKSPEVQTTQKTVNTPDFSTKQPSVQTDVDVSNEDSNYDDNFFGNEEDLGDFESVFEEKPTIDRTSHQPSKTGAPKSKGHSSSHDSSSHAISSHDGAKHDSKVSKTPISQEPAVISSDHHQNRKQPSAKSPITKGPFPSYPSLYSPTSTSDDDPSFPLYSSNKPTDESRIDRPDRYTADMTYSAIKGQKTVPSNTFVEVPDQISKDFSTAIGSNDKQLPNQHRVTEQQQSNSKSPVYNFPPRQVTYKSSYEQLAPVVPVLTPGSPIIYNQGFEIPVEYVI